jgi:hypothetical protein
MGEEVSTNYRVFYDQFLRFIPFLVVAGVALFLTGRKLKRGQQKKGMILPNITITVSGISSNMVDYAKCIMVVGRDF